MELNHVIIVVECSGVEISPSAHHLPSWFKKKHYAIAERSCSNLILSLMVVIVPALCVDLISVYQCKSALTYFKLALTYWTGFLSNTASNNNICASPNTHKFSSSLYLLSENINIIRSSHWIHWTLVINSRSRNYSLMGRLPQISSLLLIHFSYDLTQKGLTIIHRGQIV